MLGCVLAALPAAGHLSPQLRANLRSHAETGVTDLADEPRERERTRLQLAVLERKHNELVAVASAGDVEDAVMWEVQRLLDNEETRLEALLAGAEAASGSPMAAGSAVVAQSTQSPVTAGAEPA